MVDKKFDFGHTSYIVGILSIVFAATFNPLPGIILGIVGLVLGKRQRDPASARGRKFSTIGIIISLIVLLITILLASLLGTSVANFPTG
jgi:hypothetical protein